MKIITVKNNTFINRGLLLTLSSLLTGILFGIVVYIFNENDLKHKINDILSAHYHEFTDSTTIKAFITFSTSGILFFIIMLIGGSGIFGRISTTVLIIYKTAGLSAFITHMYSSYGIDGLKYILLVFFPGKVILMFSLIYIADSCYKITEYLNNNSKLSFHNLKTSKKIYCFNFLLALAVIATSWLIDSICTNLFSDVLIL